MKIAFALVSQMLVGIAVCSGAAFGLSLVGKQVLVESQASCSSLAFGQCRRCANTIRFAPGEWCSMCRVCGQLTNSDQAADFMTQDDDDQNSRREATADLALLSH